MTSYTNDPVRVKITLDDIWRITNKKGIDSAFHEVPESNGSQYWLKLSCSDTDPWCPIQENYKEDLERELQRFNILQDHCRDFAAYKPFNNSNKVKVLETVLDPKVFSKENRYDILLDKATNIHYLQDGRLFGIIEGE